MMNDKAATFGMKDYKFVNSTGLNNADLKGKQPAGGPEDENVMSARSVAIQAYRLIHDYPDVLKTASIPQKWFQQGTDDQIRMDNWNWMLPGSMYPVLDYPGVDGIKTGSTDLGGYSFTGTAKKGDLRLLTVVMKVDANTTIARFNETRKLMDYGFNNYELKEIFPAGYKVQGKETLSVKDGDEDKVGIESQKPMTAAVKKGEDNQYEPVLEISESQAIKGGTVTAPVEKGQVLGYLTANYKGSDNNGYLTSDCKEKIPMVASTTVKKAGWLALFFRSIINFFKSLFG
jgi:D-alanyl-D-alanine carboxypeptidase (penicillin-binding protein 5/6)